MDQLCYHNRCVRFLKYSEADQRKQNAGRLDASSLFRLPPPSSSPRPRTSSLSPPCNPTNPHHQPHRKNSRRRLHLLPDAPRRPTGRGAAPAEREDHQELDRGSGGRRKEERRRRGGSGQASSGRGRRTSKAGAALSLLFFLGSEQGEMSAGGIIDEEGERKRERELV